MRFMCRTVLATLPGVRFHALIDTGAPFAIIPWALWKDGVSRIEFAEGRSDWKTIRGIAGGREPCEFGRIHIMLTDTKPSFSDWLEIPAQLAKTDDVPLILGVAGLLDTYGVTLNEGGESHIVVPGL